MRMRLFSLLYSSFVYTLLLFGSPPDGVGVAGQSWDWVSAKRSQAKAKR